MTEPTSTPQPARVDLDAIEARAVAAIAPRVAYERAGLAIASQQDVGPLLAEVRRLREEVADAEQRGREKAAKAIEQQLKWVKDVTGDLVWAAALARGVNAARAQAALDGTDRGEDSTEGDAV